MKGKVTELGPNADADFNFNFKFLCDESVGSKHCD